MSEFTADILIVIFVLYFISYLLILKELSYKNALKNENIELDTLVTFRCYQTKERETIISFLVSNNEFKEDWRLVTNKIHKKTLAP